MSLNYCGSQFTFHLINYGKARRTPDNGGVSALAAGYAGGAEGRHDDDEAGRLADDEAGLSYPDQRDCAVRQRANNKYKEL